MKVVVHEGYKNLYIVKRGHNLLYQVPLLIDQFVFNFPFLVSLFWFPYF